MTGDDSEGRRQRIREEVRAGTYRVDPAVVADAILARWSARGIADAWMNQVGSEDAGTVADDCSSR